MNDETDAGVQAEALKEIADVLRRHPEAASSNEASPLEAARGWVAAGFDDPEEIDEWLRARCFTPAGAAALERAGITPEQAAIRTRGGEPDYEETIGCKLSRGHLSAEEARRIVTNEFWNT